MRGDPCGPPEFVDGFPYLHLHILAFLRPSIWPAPTCDVHAITKYTRANPTLNPQIVGSGVFACSGVVSQSVLVWARVGVLQYFFTYNTRKVYVYV